MPTSIRIEPETGVAVIACTGVLGQQEAEEGAASLWATPSWPGRSAVWDFRTAEFDLTGSEIQSLAKYILQKQPMPPPKKVAFVTPRDADFGMARMFEVFREDAATGFRVFRSWGDALAWARSTDP